MSPWRQKNTKWNVDEWLFSILISQGTSQQESQLRDRLCGLPSVRGSRRPMRAEEFRSTSTALDIGTAAGRLQAESPRLSPPPRSQTGGTVPLWNSHCRCRGASASRRRRRTAGPAHSPDTHRLFWASDFGVRGWRARSGLSDPCLSPAGWSGNRCLYSESGSPASRRTLWPRPDASPSRPPPPPSSGARRCRPPCRQRTTSHWSAPDKAGRRGAPGRTSAVSHRLRWAGWG